MTSGKHARFSKRPVIKIEKYKIQWPAILRGHVWVSKNLDLMLDFIKLKETDLGLKFFLNSKQ